MCAVALTAFVVLAPVDMLKKNAYNVPRFGQHFGSPFPDPAEKITEARASARRPARRRATRA